MPSLSLRKSHSSVVLQNHLRPCLSGLAFLLFFLSIIFYFIKPLRKLLFLTGMCGIALCISFLLICPSGSSGINEIQYQQNQYDNILKFSANFLPHSNVDQSKVIKFSFGNTIEKIHIFFIGSVLAFIRVSLVVSSC